MALSEKLEKQLLAIQTSIQKKYGKESITYLGSKEIAELPRFSACSRSLDRALGGGMPEGRIIELFGPPSSGKSTTCLHCIASMQKKYPEMPVAYMDSEFSYDPSYAAALGVDNTALLVSQPETGHLTFDIMCDLIEAGVKLIVVDSVAALLPKEEDDASMNDNQMGVQARMMSRGLRKLNTYAGKAGCTIIFTNQTRNKIGVVYGDPTVTSGGNALPFYASVRCRFQPSTIISDSNNEKTARRTKVTVVKNKTYKPFTECEFDIKFGVGFDETSMILDEMFTVGIAKMSGSWVQLFGKNVGQGKDRLSELVESLGAWSFFDSCIERLDSGASKEELAEQWEEYKKSHEPAPVQQDGEQPAMSNEQVLAILKSQSAEAQPSEGEV